MRKLPTRGRGNGNVFRNICPQIFLAQAIKRLNGKDDWILGDYQLRPLP